MPLIGNHSVLNKTCATFRHGTATAGAFAGNNRSNWGKSGIRRNAFTALPRSFSIPQGTSPSYSLLISQINSQTDLASFTLISGSGSISGELLKVHLCEATIAGVGSISQAALAVITPAEATLSGSGSISQAALDSVSALSATLSGSGTISQAAVSATVPLDAALSGTGSVSPVLTGIGSLSALIEIGAVEGLSAGDIWNYDISGIDTAGTAGSKLNDAGSAGNPWEADLTTNNTPGTFGALIQKLLTLAQFLGLK